MTEAGIENAALAVVVAMLAWFCVEDTAFGARARQVAREIRDATRPWYPVLLMLGAVSWVLLIVVWTG